MRFKNAEIRIVNTRTGNFKCGSAYVVSAENTPNASTPYVHGLYWAKAI